MVVSHLLCGAGVFWVGWHINKYRKSTNTLSSEELRKACKTISFEYQEELRKKRVTIPEADFRKIDPLFIMPQVPTKGEADI